jgi:hypothetical protein
MAMSLFTRMLRSAPLIMLVAVAAVIAANMLVRERPSPLPAPRSHVPANARWLTRTVAVDGSIVELWLTGSLETRSRCWYLVDIDPRGERRATVSACGGERAVASISHVFDALLGTKDCSGPTVEVSSADGAARQVVPLFEGHFLLAPQSAGAGHDALDVACVAVDGRRLDKVRVQVAGTS